MGRRSRLHLLSLLASGRPCPSCQPPPCRDAPRDPRRAGAASRGFEASLGRMGGATRLLLFLGPGRRAELTWRVGASRSQRAGRGAGGRGEEQAEDEDVHARWGGGGGRSQVLAALQLVGFLSVGGGRHTDVHYVVAGGLVMGCAVGDLLLRHDAVNFCEDVLERFLYVGGIQG